MTRLAATLAVVSTLAASSASAQEAVSAERFEPSLDRDGILNVEWAGIPQHLNYDATLWMGYALNPLVLYRETDDGGVERAGSLVKHRLGADLVGAISIYEWVQVGLDVPFTIYQGEGGGLTEAGVTREVAGAGLGDLRLVPKVRLLSAKHDGLIDLAVAPVITLPTAAPRGDFHGEEDFAFEPQALASRALGDLRLAAGIGYKWRPSSQLLDVEVGPELTYRAGAALRLAAKGSAPFELLASVSGSTSTAAPFQDYNTSPMELDLGAQSEVQDDVQLFAGGGFGLRAGYGTPDLRLFVGVRYSPRASDEDGDRILDNEDKCPEKPEDADGFEDADGCPDPDNDKDGVADTKDDCDDDAEDFDKFKDDDGCPEADNDDDGLVDAYDNCPVVAEDKDDYEDQDGCPESDNDKDGLDDAKDKCPDQAEDKDKFEDDDGCPEADNDKDGIDDKQDKCPDKAEVINGVDDEDGCPDEGKSQVQLTESKIEITDRVYFDTGKATIQSRSHSLLQQVAATLRAHPEITKLRIEGHTDDKGNDASNLKLSQERADSVKAFLIGRNIDPARLEAVGFGETKPIGSNKTSRGRDMNRRVEFVIVEVDGKPRAQPQ